jgi:hypothetical protein
MNDGIEKHLPPRAENVGDATAGIGEFKRTLTDKELAKKAREQSSRTMGIYISPIGEQGHFTKDMSGISWNRLNDVMRLLITVGMVEDSRYSSLYDTEDKKREFMLRLMNKGRQDGRKKDPQLMTEEDLEDMIALAVEDGLIAPDYDDGIALTEKGLGAVASTTNTGWRNPK